VDVMRRNMDCCSVNSKMPLRYFEFNRQQAKDYSSFKN
jgi:hypothetical protein